MVCESVPTSESGNATPFSRPHDLREVLEVDLVADAGAGRHDLHVRERLLAPAEEQVALVVALVLELDVLLERERRAVLVDLHRVIDHEVDRAQRVDRVAGQAELDERVAHRGEVAHRGNAGEVLHQHARGAELDLVLDALLGVPAGDRLDVGGLDGLAVLVAEQVLEQDAQRVGQRLDVADLLLDERVEPVELDLAAADGDLRFAAETVGRHVMHPFPGRI